MKNFTAKKILLIIVIAMALLWIVLNYDTVVGALTFIGGIFMPLTIGFCIAFILNVLMKYIENRLLGRLFSRICVTERANEIARKLKRPLSLIITLIIVAGIVVFVSALVIPSLADAIASLISYIPGFAKTVQEGGAELITVLGLDDALKDYYVKDLGEFVTNLIKFLENNGTIIANGVTGALAGVFSWLANLVLGIVFAVYILLTKERLGRQVSTLLNAYLPEKANSVILKIAALVQKQFENFISGQVLAALCIGILTYLGSLVIYTPYAPMLGVLIGFTALIPIVGAWVGTIVGALLLLIVDPWKALIFIIFILVLQAVDNQFIYPKIVGKQIGLPGMWVFLAVIVGGSIGGITGILVCVPLFSVIYILLKENSEKRRAKREKTEVETKSIQKTKTDT